MMKSIRVIFFALVALAALFALAACDSGGAPATPGVATRPTATTEAVQPHRLRPRATPTVEEASTNEQPTEEAQAVDPTPEPPVDFGITYTNYAGKSGNWSIDYPDGWTLVEDDPNTQFTEPSEEAFIQVTTAPMDPGNTNEDLVKIASDNLKAGFGETYVELGQEQQSDGSYRIDFTFNIADTDWSGQTFVEGRQSNLYMLFLATPQTQSQSEKYIDVFNHVIGSYVLPEK